MCLLPWNFQVYPENLHRFYIVLLKLASVQPYVFLDLISYTICHFRLQSDQTLFLNYKYTKDRILERKIAHYSRQLYTNWQSITWKTTKGRLVLSIQKQPQHCHGNPVKWKTRRRDPLSQPTPAGGSNSEPPTSLTAVSLVSQPHTSHKAACPDNAGSALGDLSLLGWTMLSCVDGKLTTVSQTVPFSLINTERSAWPVPSSYFLSELVPVAATYLTFTTIGHSMYGVLQIIKP